MPVLVKILERLILVLGSYKLQKFVVGHWIGHQAIIGPNLNQAVLCA
jgi:hypothetical protein